jgi:hypothetical protein
MRIPRRLSPEVRGIFSSSAPEFRLTAIRLSLYTIQIILKQNQA